MHKMILAALLPLAACGNFDGDDGPGIAGTGSGNERSYAVRDFTAVDLSGSDDVDVQVGAGFSVQATGDEKALERLKIQRKGDTLSIGRRSGFNWGSGAARVVVTMPRITKAALSGSGNMGVSGAEGEKFGASLAGSGTLSLNALSVEEARFSIAGSGDINANGSADAVAIDIAGSGNVNAPRMSARSADVSIAGSGDVTAVVDGEARVSIMGSGDVDLGPKARCRVTKAGSGTVRCGN